VRWASPPAVPGGGDARRPVAAAATVSVAAACAGPLWASAADDSTALARLEQLDRAELAVSARQPVTPGRLPDGLPALDPGAMGPPQPGSLRTAWDAVRLPEPVHGWYGDPEVLVTTQLAGLRRMEDDGRPAGVCSPVGPRWPGSTTSASCST
jgi:hypothetical protein